MKWVYASIIFLMSFSSLNAQSITIGDDGIVRCNDVPIGTKQTIFGDTYEVVDRELLLKRRDEGADLSKACVSNVTDMSMMFNGLAFNQPIGNWDVSKVTDMSSMFKNSNFDQPIGNWDVSKVTDMSYMFSGSTIFNRTLDTWNVSGVTKMIGMFYGAKKFNKPLDSWDVSSVITMNSMFGATLLFNQDLNSWDVSNVRYMSEMFVLSQAFNGDISEWNVSNVRYMISMFSYSEVFNQNLNKWDVSNVIDMSEMFRNAKAFNSNLDNWNLISVESMTSIFDGASLFNGNITTWNMNKIQSTQYFFRNAISFNQDISQWNVSNVKYFNGMFDGARLFNQNISNWNVSNGVSFDNMFYKASSFNQNLSDWCMRNVPSEPRWFSTGSLIDELNKPIWGTCPGLPNKINVLFPLHLTIDIDKNIVLTWNKDILSTKYQIQLFEGFDPIVLDEITADTTYSILTHLKGNTTYNWRVRGINENKMIDGEPLVGDWSTVWSFTTIFDPNEETDFNIELLDKWNLIGLPLEIVHSSFQELFESSVAGSLFKYANTYQSQETLVPGLGYWIRMEEAGNATLRGGPIESLSLELQSGWNLISGPSESVTFESIEDSDAILLEGSLFGFNGAYTNASVIEPGKGYWIRTTKAGTITLDNEAATKSTGQDISESLTGFEKVEFLSNSPDGQLGTLYLDGDIPSGYSSVNFELPPLPPQGITDIRWSDGTYLNESNRATALIQRGTGLIQVRVPSISIDKTEMDGVIKTVTIREFNDDLMIKESHLSRNEVFTLSDQTNKLEIEILDKPDLPVEFTLDQNYPNPFNPTTTIRFGLPESADVSLEVYSVLGQKVRTLINENRSAGWHTVNFNGSGLSSGVYVYRIQAGGMVQTRKLLLVK